MNSQNFSAASVLNAELVTKLRWTHWFLTALIGNKKKYLSEKLLPIVHFCVNVSEIWP